MKKMMPIIAFFSYVPFLSATTTVLWDTHGFEEPYYTNGQWFIYTNAADVRLYAVITNAFKGTDLGTQFLYSNGTNATLATFEADMAYTNGTHNITFDMIHLGSNSGGFASFGDFAGLGVNTALGQIGVSPFDGNPILFDKTFGDIFSFSWTFNLDEHWFDVYLDGNLLIDHGVLAEGVVLDNVRFQTETGYLQWRDTAIDNFYWSVTTADAIPEPATVTLLLLGGGFLAAKKRKKI
jgi:hypothetical protein